MEAPQVPEDLPVTPAVSVASAEPNVVQRVEAKLPLWRRIPRWGWWVGGSVLVLLVGLGGVWASPLGDRIQPARVTVQVREAGTGVAVVGARVTVATADVTTSEAGDTELLSLPSGALDVSVVAVGYTSTTVPVTLARGSNEPLLIELAKVTKPLVSAQGTVVDYVTRSPLAGVTVRVAGKEVTTDAAGGFTVADLAEGTYRLQISQPTYVSLEEQVEVGAEPKVLGVRALVPQGDVVVASNRSGKRALYLVGFDGSVPRRFAGADVGEDFAPQSSPSLQKVAFLSNRDQVRLPYGGIGNRLYIANKDGGQVNRVGEDTGVSKMVWAPDSATLFYTSADGVDFQKYVSRIVRPDTMRVNTLPDGPTYDPVFRPDGRYLYYSVSVAIPATEEVAAYTEYRLYQYDVVQANAEVLVRTQNEYINVETVSADEVTFKQYKATGEVRKSYRFKDGSLSEIGLAGAAPRAYVTTPYRNEKLFVDERDGRQDVYRLLADGSEKRVTVTGGVAPLPSPLVDATGRYVVYAVSLNGETALYAIGIDGGEVRKLSEVSLSAYEANGS